MRQHHLLTVHQLANCAHLCQPLMTCALHILSIHDKHLQHGQLLPQVKYTVWHTLKACMSTKMDSWQTTKVEMLNNK